MSSQCKKIDVILSKKLSYLLRHGAVREGLNIRSDGFILVEELLSKSLRGYTLNDIQRVVENNSKNRFTLCSFNNALWIKANQGHSLSEIDTLNLRPVKSPTFDIIHGTYFSCWEKIKREGLSRMKRNHIHFAKGLNFICGLRKNSEIYIYISFEKAIKNGLRFEESNNGVILCTGNSNGIIETKYFLKTVSKDGELLFPC
ncbi:tRNA 2'-phosphotransferase 1 [Orussus abietinus]|uniref:tRNA 2'-phosphotransferase 1 n=1 Tax=Orussus abietinus TaxID=222816 RepID=UPI0006264972|nr:tRNA 2'-phosphotransferase 1 [Orussus abietinus]